MSAEVIFSAAQTAGFDILSQIFVSSLPHLESAEAIRPLSLSQPPLNVSHVCRSWRETSLGTPQLWSRICLQDLSIRSGRPTLNTEEYWSSMQDRSRDHPLDFNLLIQVHEDDDGSNDNGPVWRSSFNRILERLFSRERHRWRLVHIDAPTNRLPYRSLAWDGEQKVAVLELPQGIMGISVRTTDENDNEVDSNGHGRQPDVALCLDFSKCAKIAQISISHKQSRSSMLWAMYESRTPALRSTGPSQILASLTSLHLTFGSCVNPLLYLTLLSSFPSLECLTGEFPFYVPGSAEIHFGGTYLDFSLPTELSNISLPKLLTIDLKSGPYVTSRGAIIALALFNRLLAPSLQTLRLRIDNITTQSMRRIAERSGHAIVRMLTRSEGPPIKHLELHWALRENLLIDILELVPGVEYLSIAGAKVTGRLIETMCPRLVTTTPENPESDGTGPATAVPVSGGILCPQLRTFITDTESLDEIDSVHRLLVTRARSGTHRRNGEQGYIRSTGNEATCLRTLEHAVFRTSGNCTRLLELMDRPDIVDLVKQGLELEFK